MKRGVLAILGLVFIVLSLVGVYANEADVAYIYRNERRVDSNFVEAFEGMGLSVDLVNEKDLGDLGEYRFIFVGDEKFREEIPVGGIPEFGCELLPRG